MKLVPYLLAYTMLNSIGYYRGSESYNPASALPRSFAPQSLAMVNKVRASQVLFGKFFDNVHCMG